MIKNRVLYAIALVLCFILLFFTKAQTVITLFYALLIFPVVAMALNAISARFLKITQQLGSSSLIIGEESKYTITIFNKGLLFVPSFSYTRPAVSTRKPLAPVSFSIKSQETVTDEMNVSFAHRGVYHLSPGEVYATDYLGLFRINLSKWIYKPMSNPATVTVYPQIIDIHSFPLSYNLISSAYSHFALMSEDYASLADLRPYQPSDSMRRIHWKASAKRNELIVKMFESSAFSAATVFVDTRGIHGATQFRLEAEDKIAELTVSVCRYCLARHIPVNIRLGHEEISARGMRDFERLYSAAACVPFDDEKDLMERRLQLFLNEEALGCNIVVIASTLDGKLLDVLLRAKAFGHYVVVIHVPCEDEGVIAVRMLDSGLTLIRCDIGANLPEVFGHGWSANAR
ncbi:MAG: DUF58 domain-containing protein [Clostridiales bacterium]|jgi:uncharacterized protein (DUF58 family)|nr:DUF58 domain-containing protein [Clostridiales bacterium]